MRWFTLAISCLTVAVHASLANSQIVMYGLPLPVTRAEADVLIDRVQMDAAQADVVRAMHADYWDKWQALFGESGPQCRRLRTRLNNFNRDHEPPDDRTAVDLLSEFNDQLGRICPVMQAMNEGLWNEIRTVVAGAQHGLVFRAAVAHARLEQSRELIAYRERSVDLAALLEPSIQRSRDALANAGPATQTAPDTGRELRFSEEELTVLDEILAEYELELLGRLNALITGQERAASFLAQAADGYRDAYAKQREPDASAKALGPLFARARAIQASGMQPVLGPSLRIVESNRAALGRIRDALPQEGARAVEMMYFAAAYPEVYPDDADATVLYDVAQAQYDLSPDQRAALVAMRSTFQQEHDRLSRQMMDSVFRRGQVTMGSAPDFAGQAIRLWAELAELGRKREKLNADQAPLIAGVLSPEQAGRLPSWDFDKNPPKRRWTRGSRLN